MVMSGNQEGVALRGPEIWEIVRDKIRAEIAQSEFDKWIAPLRFVAEVDGTVLILARTEYDLHRVRMEFGRKISMCWKRADMHGRSVDMQCWATAPGDIRELIDYPWPEDVFEARPDGAKAGALAADKAASGPSMMRFDTLVTGESNSLAAQIARDVASGASVPASVIFINGVQGVGKTHLMKALEGELDQQSRRTVAYISAEEFYVAYVEGVMNGDTRALKARVRTADIVLFDDLQIIAGKKGANSELAGTIRTVSERGGLVVVTADSPLSELSGLSAQVTNVIKGGVCIEISPPDRSMRREIVLARIEQLAATASAFEFDDHLVDHIVSRVRGAGRHLCGVVLTLFAETRFGTVKPTLETIERVIARHQGKGRPITLDAIKRAVCSAYEVTKSDLEGERKFQKLVRARQVGMFLAREKTAKSFPQIGIAFGGRHHTTVLYAQRKVRKLLLKDSELAAEVEGVCQALNQIMHG